MGFSLCTCIVVTEKKREKRAEPWQLCSTVRVGGHSAVIVAAVAVVAAAASLSPLLLMRRCHPCSCCCRRCFCCCCRCFCCCCRCFCCCCRCFCCSVLLLLLSLLLLLLLLLPSSLLLLPSLLLPLSLLPLSLFLLLLLLLLLSSPSPSGEMAHLVARLPTPLLGSYRCCCGGHQSRHRLIHWRWAQRWSVGWDGMRDWGKRAMTNVVVRFRDAPHGLPTSWVPPDVSPSPNHPSNDNKPPTSLWKGEGQLRCDLASEVS